MPGHDATGRAGHRLAVFGRDRRAALSARAGMLGSRCREPWPPRSAHVRSRENRARRAVRRTVLHRRADDADLLPADLPGEAARSRNVVFFPTAAAAERAGFRPCLRCRPETAPGTPAWHGAAASVSRARRLIERGFLDDAGTVDGLADTLGMTARHLRRLFLRHAGASPTAVATTRRVQRAKTLLDETALPVSAVAFAAGFTSIRRFNAAFRSVYRRPPGAVRRRRARRQSAADTVAARQMRRAPL